MLDLQEIYDTSAFIASKDQSGNTFSPFEFNTMIQAVNIALTKKEWSKFEASQEITDDMMRFKIWLGADGVAPLTVDNRGYSTLPVNYWHYVSLLYKQVINKPNCKQKIKPRIIPVLNDQQFDAYRASALKQPSLRYPVANFQNGYLRFLPVNLGMVDFVYLREPVQPVYAYHIDPLTDEIIYEQSNSVQFEWGNSKLPNIVDLLLNAIGINLKMVEIQSYLSGEQALKQV
jgi:hypothetical protein